MHRPSLGKNARGSADGAFSEAGARTAHLRTPPVVRMGSNNLSAFETGIQRRRGTQHQPLPPISVGWVLERLRGIQLHQTRLGPRTLHNLAKISPEQLQHFETLELNKPTAYS